MTPLPPISPELSRAMGALNAGRFRLAADLAKVARQKSPNDPRVLLTLGQSLSRSGRSREALPILRKAVSLDRTNTGYRFELGHALDDAARSDEALTEIDAVLEIDPLYYRAIQVRCGILRRTGRAAEAWAWLEPRLADLPPTPAVAIAATWVLPSDASPEPILKIIRDALADPRNSKSSERRSLFYALAKLLDRQGHYDEAFAAAETANRLFHKSDLTHHHKLIARMTPSLLASIEPSGIDASNIVLVCGMPRSGTTLTEQILNAHPDVATVGESATLGSLVKTALTHADEDGLVPSELSAKLAKQYLKHLREVGLPDGQNAKVFVDKMPQNIMYLGVVDRLLPGCRVIRCVRDPRDIALSCYMQDFNDAHAYRSTFESLADELLLHEAVATRWKLETTLPILESHLEELTAEPEKRAREMIAFAGLEWNDVCLRFHEVAGHVKTASVDQIRSGINTRGVGRWKRYEKQLAPLIERLAPILPDEPDTTT